MAKQLKFRNPFETIHLDSSRKEPLLWVRQLVIWESPETPLREIKFRKGLNIIWSPDPGEIAATPGEQAEIGHGAGKTLLTRFIRYCLGEDRFAPQELRDAIATRFPEGHVGAEVLLAGVPWAIVRPIGIRRKHHAVENGDLADLVRESGPETGMAPFLEALRSTAIAPLFDLTIPGTSDAITWLHVLAWLSRDQECHFEHVLTWRHKASGSDSPAENLPKEVARFIVRAGTSLIGPSEIREEANQKNLLREEKQLSENSTKLQFFLKRLAGELAKHLRVEPGVFYQNDLDFRAHLAKADKLVEQASDKLKQTEMKNQLSALEADLLNEENDAAVLREQLKQHQGTLEVSHAQLAALKGERAELTDEEIIARLGPICPVCSVPIDEVLAKGCGISLESNPFENVHEEIISTEDKILRRQNLISKQQSGVQKLQEALRNREATIKSLIRERAALEQTIQERDGQLREDWRIAIQRRIDIQRIEQIHEELATDQLKRLDIEGKAKDSRVAQEKLQKRHKKALKRLSELFDYVVKGLFEVEAEGVLQFHGQDLKPTLQLGGDRNTAAVNSLKALAFDLAALFFTLEGQTCLPAFLIHDSPRESDQGLSIYHKIFKLIYGAEALTKEPPFQYIITTTTNPPQEFQKAPFVRAKLHGTPAEQRLLTVDL